MNVGKFLLGTNFNSREKQAIGEAENAHARNPKMLMLHDLSFSFLFLLKMKIHDINWERSWILGEFAWNPTG